MRRITSALTAMILTLGALTMLPASASTATDPAVVPGSWIVELNGGHDPRSESAKLARQNNGRVGHVYTAAISGFSFYGSDRAAANLARNPKVSRVEPNRRVHAVGTVPTGVRRIDSRDSNGTHTISSSTGTGVSVAVLDTGVDDTHTELNGRVSAGKSCISSEPDPTADGHGHGTHVSGTVAGTSVGVAPGATIVPVKVLDSSGSGDWATVMCGVDYVTANASTIKVANMSLGGSSSESGGCSSSTLHTAICNSVAAGVSYMVSSGNDSRDASGYVPAKYPAVMTVSAFSDLDGVRDPADGSECVGFGRWKDCDETFARFSNYGTIVDIMAPGVRIYSSVPGGYDTYSGTSMSAPHVAGVAALVLEDNTLSVADLEARLKGNGECPNAGWAPADGACAGTWSGDGDGVAEPMVNAARAVANASGVGGGTISDPVETGTIAGTVTVAGTTTAIAGATVTVDNTTHTATTDTNGAYTLAGVPVGTGYSVTATATGYDAVTHTGIAVTADTTTTVHFALSATPEPEPGSYTTSVSYAPSGGPQGDKHMDVTVNVTDGTNPLANATVVVDISKDGSVIWAGATGTTDGAGNVVFSLKNSGPGCYTTDVKTVNGTAPGTETDPKHGC